MRSRRSAFFVLLSTVTVVLILCAAARPNPKPAQSSSELAARIQRVKNGIPPIPLSDTAPPVQLSLEQWMNLYKVPGLSVAVIDNFKIAWAKGYGVAEPGSHNPITIHTLFQAGSISKPVAATGTLSLVQQGK